MKTFQKKFVALTAVAGLAVLGAACESETEVSPGVEEPADDVVVEEETTVESDTGTDTGATEDTMETEADATATETSTEG